MSSHLTDAQSNALSLLYDSPSGLPFRDLALDNQDFHALLQSGLVIEPEGTMIEIPNDSPLFVHEGFVLVTPAGKASVECSRKETARENQRKADQECTEAKRLQERREDYANDERRYRTQNKIAIIMPFITFVLGVLVEHWTGIAGYVFSLFH